MRESHHNFAAWASASCEPIPVILSDVTKRGRERPWHLTKLMNEAAARAYRALGGRYTEFAERMEDCATRLYFDCQEVGGEKRKRLSNENKFCHCRQCMTCQWRRSLVLQDQLETCANAYLDANPGHHALFMTLTVQNVAPEDLPDAVNKLLVGFDRLRRYKDIALPVKAWCKRVEFTRNADTGHMHPHVHALLMVGPEYFKGVWVKSRKKGAKPEKKNLYITQDKLTALWQKAMRLEYTPVVDIRKVGAGRMDEKRRLSQDELRKAVNETAKYMVKPNGIYVPQSDGTYSIDPVVLKSLHDATEDRRLVGWGGAFKELRQRLRLEDSESEAADLILVKGETLLDSGEVVNDDGELLEVGPKWKEVYARRRINPTGPPQYTRSYTTEGRVRAQAGEWAAPDRREGQGGPPLASAIQTEHRKHTA